MARIDNINNFLTDVADSIRTKTGKSNKIPASSFDTEIASITTSEDLDTELATYNTELTEQEESLSGIVEYLENKIESGEPLLLQDKSIEITENGTINIVADEGYDGLINVKINVNVESASSNRLYLIKNGVEQTDVTGGSTLEVAINNGGAGTTFQGDGYLGLCAQYPSYWRFTFNNVFDYKTYPHLYVDWAFPESDNLDKAEIALRTSVSVLRLFLKEATDNNVKERRTDLLDLSTATDKDKIRFIFGNTSSATSAYKDYPVQIFNLYLEKN